jgi:hypothetical protein
MSQEVNTKFETCRIVFYKWDFTNLIIFLFIFPVETKSFGPHLQKIPDQEAVEGSAVLLKCIAAG